MKVRLPGIMVLGIELRHNLPGSGINKVEWQCLGAGDMPRWTVVTTEKRPYWSVLTRSVLFDICSYQDLISLG